jgi:hypothetical protein
MQGKPIYNRGVCTVIAMLLLSWPALATEDDQWRSKVDDCVLVAVDNGSCEFLVYLTQQADLGRAARLESKRVKGHYVFETLRSLAARTQTPIVRRLESEEVTYRTFWITNSIWVRGDAQVLEMLARRDDVARIHANPRIRFAEPRTVSVADSDGGPRSVEWNISLVNGPAVWAEGNIGQAAVVGGIDTGYAWEHPALREQYRGWDGAAVDHDYNWHDAIHSGGGACGADSPEPCDDNGHGTHTMGTMVGDDGGANQIGLAPGARWIGCRCLDQGYGTPATFIECLEWMVAPYPVGGSSAEGDPTLAPDVVNNSWSCPPSLGCAWDTLLPVIENVRAAGIVVVAIAGGSGPDCSSIQYPPDIYEASFTVGATSSLDIIAGYGRIDALVACSGAVVAVEDPAREPLPAAVRLLPNIPNPFNPVTTISFELPASSRVDLRIYDVSGRLMRILLGEDLLEAGRHEVAWNGRDESGRIVSAGVYFCRLEAGSITKTRRMTLVK